MKKAAPFCAVAALAVVSFSAPALAEETEQPVMEINKAEQLEQGDSWVPDIPEIIDRLLGFVWGGP